MGLPISRIAVGDPAPGCGQARHDEEQGIRSGLSSWASCTAPLVGEAARGPPGELSTVSAGKSGRILAPQTLPNPRRPVGVGERANSAATWLGQGAHHVYLPLRSTQKPSLPSTAQRSRVSYVCVSVASGGTLFRQSVLSQREKQGGSRKRHV